MKKRVIVVAAMCLCLAGCKSPASNEAANSENNSQNEANVDDKVQLKDLNYDELKEIISSDTFDWNELVTTYKLEQVDTDEAGTYYSAYIDYNGEKFEVHAQAGLVGTDEASTSMVYLQNETTCRIFQMYLSESGKVCTWDDVDTFLNRDDSLTQYLTIDVPEGYKLGTFRLGLDLGQGCLLYLDGEEELDYMDYSQRHGGVFVCENNDEIIKFEDGEMYVKGSAISNTFEFEPESTDISLGDGCQAMMGTGTEDETEFWYIFAYRESDDMCFMMYFNADEFTKEQVIDIAESVELQ